MRKVRLGRTNLEVTRWVLGGIPLSTMMGGRDEATIHRVLHAALDRVNLGVNLGSHFHMSDFCFAVKVNSEGFTGRS